MAQISLSCSPRSSASTRSKEVLRQISGIRKEGWGGVGGGCPLLLNVEGKLKGIWKFHPSLRQTHLGKTTPWSSSQGKPNGGTPCPRRGEELGKMCKNMYIYIYIYSVSWQQRCFHMLKIVGRTLEARHWAMFRPKPKKPTIDVWERWLPLPPKKRETPRLLPSYP